LELVLSASLNMDALYTIRHPFSRIQNLNNLFVVIRVTIVFLVVVSICGVVVLFAYAEAITDQDIMIDPHNYKIVMQ